jgi:hypothetical protein
MMEELRRRDSARICRNLFLLSRNDVVPIGIDSFESRAAAYEDPHPLSGRRNGLMTGGVSAKARFRGSLIAEWTEDRARNEAIQFTFAFFHRFNLEFDDEIAIARSLMNVNFGHLADDDVVGRFPPLYWTIGVCHLRQSANHEDKH